MNKSADMACFELKMNQKSVHNKDEITEDCYQPHGQHVCKVLAQCFNKIEPEFILQSSIKAEKGLQKDKNCRYRFIRAQNNS